jgi:CheY-like chemotaxis protein
VVKTVLVVDDEWVIANTVAAVLSDAGYHVLIAANGRQGLERLAEERPDIILLDVMMPVLDGPGMLQAMAKYPALQDLPVVLMSSLPERTVATMADGHRAFLPKPFLTPELLGVLERVLAAGAAGSAAITSPT